MVNELILLCLVAFAAGFIDAIVGGGGLLQTPAILLILPHYPVATLLGTTKIPSMAGTTLAAFKYSKQVRFNYKVLAACVLAAFLAALLGAFLVSRIDNSVIKPVILIVLILVALYTYFNKQFGIHQEKDHSLKQQVLMAGLFGILIGFYDGLIGPGTGSFLILVFIAVLGFDFIGASAHAKIVNMATNLAAIIYFSSTGHILFQYAIPMALFNLAGAFFGTKLALLKGNKFVRVFFLIVVFGTILRFAYDILKAYVL
ncbi:sulfite exporter TauE/SafE family protein [Pedobacter kyonggii]|uniref:Probable membrane transporter protein n=1 Tax=Pedobacter kyonggii TaxID=1926871 RepID=A0A4Q9H3C1_9SPHI|nr:TSUP family transporter [Pedobacter kyonggii]TBO36399.1 sulfite exporter TauE/SafE family protein [Pedobacter kyonggii]